MQKRDLSREVLTFASVMTALAWVNPLFAATIHVSKSGSDTNSGTSWAAAKLTVRAGLNAAASGDQVWVAAGTYVDWITLKDGVEL